ncbi:ABC transporter ATP-binding protein [Halalkalibacter okhensis]|uniref:ABC transporter ATP-binding protein n=1 Tax=Halalkalibacter okhensis TaxID=333138 RepID=UPI0006916CB9|nr:ABC transporter ATP-binding protein [Halalkalibacter okhensis]
MESPLLTTNGLTKQYKKFTLGPIDMKVEKGTAIAIVGANGSGKSTFFRLIMNLLQPNSGSLEIFNQSYEENETDIKQQIGYAGELLEPFGHLSIKELAKFVSFWYSSWDEQYFQHLLERYQIDGTKKYAKCSKGMKKKVEFILSISHRPTLLILDEPSAGVDIISQKKMREDLIHYLEDGERSIILATHSIDEVKSICDWITVLHEGNILHSFDKDEMFENWGRIWISKVTDRIRNHPNVIDLVTSPIQVVTNDLQQLESDLENENIDITHVQRLTLEEGLEYLIGTNISV